MLRAFQRAAPEPGEPVVSIDLSKSPACDQVPTTSEEAVQMAAAARQEALGDLGPGDFKVGVEIERPMGLFADRGTIRSL